jgi:membrane-associated phospholipid phosphatase
MYGFKKAWWIWIYPISIWIGVVYLGEHYVIDVIIGVIYAVLAYLLAYYFFVWQRKRGWPIKRWSEKYLAKPYKKFLSKIKSKLLGKNSNQ